MQQALAKEEEYDITPLATLASSLPKRRTTAVPKSSNSMIPTSYTVPDEDYTRKMFDKFIHHLRQVQLEQMAFLQPQVTSLIALSSHFMTTLA